MLSNPALLDFYDLQACSAPNMPPFYMQFRVARLCMGLCGRDTLDFLSDMATIKLLVGPGICTCQIDY
jgi:hypothetical protein